MQRNHWTNLTGNWQAGKKKLVSMQPKKDQDVESVKILRNSTTIK